MNENIVKSFVDAVRNNDTIVGMAKPLPEIRLFGKGMLHFHNRERTWGIWVEHFYPVRYIITVSTFRYEGATQYTVNSEIYHEVLEHDAALDLVTSTIIELEAPCIQQYNASLP